MLTISNKKRDPFFGFGLDQDFNNELKKFFDVDFNQNYVKKRGQPRVNFKEEDNFYVAEFEVPGVTKKDLEVSLDDNKITIKHEKTKKDESENIIYKKKEFSKNYFTNTFSLPKNSDLENITSKCENGILYIKIPKLSSDKKASKIIDID